MALSLLRPVEPATTAVLVAERQLPAGHRLTAADVRIAQWPSNIGQPSVLTDPDVVVGRMTAGPIGSGELVTDSRVLGPGYLDMAAGAVAAPVRLADSGEANLVRTGDVVDVIAARAIDGGGQSAEPVAVNARVIAVATDDEASGSLLGAGSGGGALGEGSGNLVVLAVSEDTATDLAAAATRSRLSLVMRPRQ